MSMIRQCDRCGAVFTPYRKVISDHEKKPIAFVGVSIGTFNYKTKSLENETITYDLCPKCSRQLNVFMENRKDVKHKCYNFGNIDKQNHVCKICPRHQECEEATKEKLDAKQKKKGCNVFGAFDGSVDCLMCPQCDDSFSKWLSEPSVVNGNRSCFGEYDYEEYGCISCPTEQECKAVSKKKDAPKCFGKFDGNDNDCILCGLANYCEGKANE